MSNSREITDLVLRCRECIRTVWNSYVRDLDDAERAFSDLEDQLVDALISSQVGSFEIAKSDYGFDYFPGITVRRLPDVKFTETLFLEESTTGTKWTRRLVDLETLDLRFGGFFDFITFDNKFRDFAFVAAINVGESSISSVGSRCLVPSLDARYFELPLRR